MMRFITAALLIAAAAAQEEVAAASAAGASTINLPPFSALDVGFRGCMPLSVTVQSGPSYTFTLGGASPNIASVISADVSSDGTCILSVRSPGFQDVSGVSLTITVPDNTLRSLSVGGSANVYLNVQPASNFGVSSYGQGWVKLEPGQSLNDGNIHVYMSGGNSIAICPPGQSTISAIDVHNSGTGSVVIERTNAAQNTVELSGTGPIAITANAASRSSAQVSFSGSGASVTVGAEQVSVDLRGMGDIYLNGAKNVHGSLSGMGHVHVPVDASCFLSTTGMGGCDQQLNPPFPPVSCDSLGPSGITAANAYHWTVTVRGNSCSSSSYAVKGTVVSEMTTEMDGAVAQVESAHGHRVPDPCCTSGYSYTGTHCTTNGEHHRCCVESGQWTCGKGGLRSAAAQAFGNVLAAIAG